MYEHFSRRPKEIEDAIIASWEPSKVHKNVFSKDETKELINLFKKAPKAGSGVANYKMFDDSLNVADFEHTLAKRRPNPGETATASGLTTLSINSTESDDYNVFDDKELVGIVEGQSENAKRFIYSSTNAVLERME